MGRFGIGKWQRCYSFGTPICFTVYEKICLWFLGSFENPMFAYLRSGFPFVFPIEKTFTSKRITGLMFRSVGSLCCKQFENFLWKWHADLVYPSIDITVFQLLDLIFSFLFFSFLPLGSLLCTTPFWSIYTILRIIKSKLYVLLSVLVNLPRKKEKEKKKEKKRANGMSTLPYIANMLLRMYVINVLRTGENSSMLLQILK